MVCHQIEKRLQFQAIDHRVNDRFIGLAGNLNKTQFGPIGMLAHEFRIDRYELLFGERGAQRL